LTNGTSTKKTVQIEELFEKKVGLINAVKADLAQRNVPTIGGVIWLAGGVNANNAHQLE
jgi:hypothetical protein